jgi:transposase
MRKKPTRRKGKFELHRRRSKGGVEKALIKAAKKAGYKVTEVSPAQMARSKARSRARDARLIAEGKATPGQIQSKNDYLRGTLRVLDWSPMFR